MYPLIRPSIHPSIFQFVNTLRHYLIYETQDIVGTPPESQYLVPKLYWSHCNLRFKIAVNGVNKTLVLGRTLGNSVVCSWHFSESVISIRILNCYFVQKCFKSRPPR